MKRPSKQFLIVTGAVITLGIAGVAYSMYSSNKQASNTTVNPSQGSSSPVPSPSIAGNPGDAAKTAISNSASTPAPTATPAAASSSSVLITDFTLTPQTNSGQVYITSQITGITSGTCLLALTSPSSKSQSVNGTISFDGHFYFCSMSQISGITEAGTWNSKLNATGPGNISGSSSTQFVVGK
jgi:hypothetical protein